MRPRTASAFEGRSRTASSYTQGNQIASGAVPIREPPMSPEETDAFLQTLHSTHALHIPDESDYYTQEINKKLELRRIKKSKKSVERWRSEIEGLRKDWTEDREAREEEIRQLTLSINKSNLKRVKNDHEKEARRLSVMNKVKTLNELSSASTSLVDEGRSGLMNSIESLGAGGPRGGKRPEKGGWRRKLESVLRKVDNDEVKEALEEAKKHEFGEQTYYAAGTLSAKALLYDTTVDRHAKAIDPDTTSDVGFYSSPFDLTLREKYIKESMEKEKDDQARRERKERRKWKRDHPKIKPTPPSPPPSPPPTPPLLYDPTLVLTESEKKNYFGFQARDNYFSVYRQLTKEHTNIVPNNVDWANYKAPEFDDGSYYEAADSDEEADMNHEVGIFSDSALTPRHKVNRAFIEKQTVLNEPLMIRTTAVLGEPNTEDARLNDVLDLAGKSIGDEAVQVLADILDEIPHLRHINLRDNRLSDTTIKMIVEQLINPDKPIRLLSLDLGYNDVDGDTAEQLAKFLSSKHCHLERLCLASADVDDTELNHFCTSLTYNRTIKHLDFSHNIIGGAKELLHKTAPNIVKDKRGKRAIMPMGGEAIAMALQVNKTLTHLNLSWNQLGAKSAMLLGEMLITNKALKWLDLGYNSLTESGVSVIFQGLEENRVLEHLDVTSNNVGPAACCTLSTALRGNKVIKKIVLSENPISEQGARAICRSLKYTVEGRDIMMRGCSFSKRGSNAFLKMKVIPKIGEFLDKSTGLSPEVGVSADTPLFDMSDPVGYYLLDMSVPYNQTIASEMYYLASYSSGYHFKLLKHNGSNIKFAAPKQRTDDMMRNRRRKQSVESSASPTKPNEMGGTMDFAHYNVDWRFKTTSIYTELEGHEWVDQMEHDELIDSSTNDRWLIPTYGMLEVVLCYVPMPQAETMLANRTQINAIEAWCKAQPSMRVEIIGIFAIDGWVLSHQVQELIESMNEGVSRLSEEEVLAVLTHLIPICVDEGVLEHLLESFLGHKAMQKVTNSYGDLYPTLQGSYCAHYRLDMSKQWDRLACLRLAEQNTYEMSRLMDLTKNQGWLDKGGRGGTSQNGDWMQFRNGRWRGADVSLDTNFFQYKLGDKTSGMLEFDFVSTERIAGNSRGLSTEEFNVFCNACGFYVAPDSKNENIEKLNDAVQFIQKTADGFNARPASRPRSRSPPSPLISRPNFDKQGGSSTPRTPTNTSMNKRRGAHLQSNANKVEVINAKVKHDIKEKEYKKKEFLGLKRGDSFRKPEARSSSPDLLGSKYKDRGRGTGAMNFDAKEMFRTGIAQIRRKNVAAKMYLTGQGDSFDEKKMTEWLGDKVDLKLWSEGHRKMLFNAMKEETLEIAATDPPTLITHVLKVRFIHKKKLSALQYIAGDFDQIEREPDAWCTKLVKLNREKPADSLIMIAQVWASEIFEEYHLKAKQEKGSKKGAKATQPFTPIVRKSRQSAENEFEPKSLEGAKFICTTHWVDIIVNGLPQGSEVFSTVNSNCGVKAGSSPQGFLALRGKIVWRWQDLSRVKDVVMSYADTADKVKKVRARLGTRVITCNQAAKLASMIPVDEAEYSFNFGDTILVMKANKKGESVPHKGRIKSHNIEHDTYSIIFDDGRVDNKVLPQFIKEARDKEHYREDVVVACFSRVKDLENFNHVLATLPTQGALNVCNRLGWLNVLNGNLMEHTYDLVFKHHDHRVLVNILLKLSVVEEGKNMTCPGLPCGRNFCNKHKNCEGHQYRSERIWLENKRAEGFGLSSDWDEAKYPPDICKYSKKWKEKQGASKRFVPPEMMFSGKFTVTKEELKNIELRSEITKNYFLLGTPLLAKHPSKIRREASFKVQGYSE
ncbi:hypothetical protein TrVE_jg12444 [Triparma verrucosa]|uniref:Uncharacterized protein n=1 Tax=Triparma verrucosa TaxID=1606542 RepID=A0A9W7BBE9_9STRA|nr:hypothetical protein TrVE_jg12444 [Triparma verrucosa]